ncbi:MAG TPA: MerR family transcriptional regulator [Solirubrobacteraceae bacterium]|nr:MerR family transcriptional regulator [Solirubrobacteraceae bacterium]
MADPRDSSGDPWRSRGSVRVEVGEAQGVFMISVAAELAEMHPQTLRMYEARGLIEPQRSPKGTRLFSHRDVEQLRRIQQMTAELGLNLAGVERVFELERKLEKMAERVRSLERRGQALREEMAAELERVRRSFRAEIVPYRGIGSELIRGRDLNAFERPLRRRPLS